MIMEIVCIHLYNHHELLVLTYMRHLVYHVETDCEECLMGVSIFLGDARECPEGFSELYCEVEGVLLVQSSSKE